MTPRPAPLRPLPPRESAVQACANQLREAIVARELEAGTKLPAERALAARLGVNRLTLRAALAQLRGQGLLAVKHGSGSRVRDFAEEAGPDLLPSLLSLARSPQKRREVFEDLLRLRRALARAVLEHLEARADEGAVQRLREAVDGFALAVAAPGLTVDAVARADKAVIRALLREAGPVLALCANPVFAVLDSLPELRRAMFADPQANLAGYRGVVEALAARTPGTAQLAVQVLEALDASLLERLPGSSRPTKGPKT